MEICRDSREEVWYRTDKRTLGLLYEKYIRPSLVFQEIMPGYFALEVELTLCSEFGEDLINLIKKTYMSLFRKEILSIPLGRDFPVVFIEGKCPKLLGHLARGFQRNFLISCQQCHTIFPIERRIFSIESLYQKMVEIDRPMYDHEERDQNKLSIGFCTKRKDYICSKCQPIVNCSSCKNTFGKDMVLPGSKQCTQCFHRPSPPLLRCSHKNHQRKNYEILRECCLCQDLVCEFDSIFLQYDKKTFCLLCLRHGYGFDIILDCEESVNTYVMLTWSNYEKRPLSREGKECIKLVSLYIEAFRKIPSREKREREPRVTSRTHLDLFL